MDPLALTQQWPVSTVSAGWITGAGKSDSVGDSTHRFHLASVTKLLFSYAILIAAEEGVLPLNKPTAIEHATISNLLSHSSGLAAEATTRDNTPTLAAAGQRRIYSNLGFDLLAQELEQASAMPAADYFKEAVAEPLGLRNTTIEGSAAFAGYSTIEDLLKVAAELLNPTLISSYTLTKATSPHLPALEGILPGFGKQTPNSWGLGMEIRGMKSPHWTAASNSPATFGHFGKSGTFLWVDPLAKIGCVALTDQEFGPWATPLWQDFSEAVLRHGS